MRKTLGVVGIACAAVSSMALTYGAATFRLPEIAAASPQSVEKVNLPTAPALVAIKQLGGEENVTIPFADTQPVLSTYVPTDSGGVYVGIYKPGQVDQSVLTGWRVWNGEKVYVNTSVRGDILAVSLSPVDNTTQAKEILDTMSTCNPTPPSSNNEPQWPYNTDGTLTSTTYTTKKTVTATEPLTSTIAPEPNYLFPYDALQLIAKEKKDGTQMSAPTSPPIEPPRPDTTVVVDIPTENRNGPGCGWDFLGIKPPPRHDVTNEAKLVEENAIQSLNEKIQTFNTSYEEYARAVTEWNKATQPYVDWQNKLLKE